MELTLDQVKAILPGNKDPEEWMDALNKILPAYRINNKMRVAGFLAQCCHESNNFKVLEENLNYSAEGLNKIFPKYFIKSGRDAAKFAKQPEKIANIVYGGRMGNGDEKSGDGYRYRGRGVIQLTGKDNYTAFGRDANVNRTPEQVIEYLSTKRGALASAAWYWNSRNLNDVADTGDIVKMTKLVNGGTIGLEDRKKHYEHILEILDGKVHHTAEATPAAPKATPAAKVTTTAAPKVTTLKVGSTGDAVKALQAALGVAVDGSFGPGTQAALKEWQAKNGLTTDGVAGPKTLAALLNL
jgi:putative chitinase